MGSVESCQLFERKTTTGGDQNHPTYIGSKYIFISRVFVIKNFTKIILFVKKSKDDIQHGQSLKTSCSQSAVSSINTAPTGNTGYASNTGNPTEGWDCVRWWRFFPVKVQWQNSE